MPVYVSGLSKVLISLSLGPGQVSLFSISSPLHPLLQRDPSLCLLLRESRGSRTLGSGCWRCQEEWGILSKSPPREVPPLSLDSLGWQRNSEHQRPAQWGEAGWGQIRDFKSEQQFSQWIMNQTKESYQEGVTGHKLERCSLGKKISELRAKAKHFYQLHPLSLPLWLGWEGRDSRLAICLALTFIW